MNALLADDTPEEIQLGYRQKNHQVDVKMPHRLNFMVIKYTLLQTCVGESLEM